MLLTWIAEIADEPLLLEPTHQTAEQRTNTWCLSTDPEDRSRLSVPEVAAAFERTATAIRARIHDLGFPGPATFYVWYDAQAGQLRCSTGSVGPGELPFAGSHLPVHDLRPIVEAFLDGGNPAASATAPSPFPVWVRDVG
ncbi:hypothetical protein [Streptomyces sp. NPDC012510]|uniref:hypothetical protein n=1 Tax=Streptomyces sp. NPDC012510 TaxID=3364838 RepID=UPI0036E9176C